MGCPWLNMKETGKKELPYGSFFNKNQNENESASQSPLRRKKKCRMKKVKKGGKILCL